MANKHKLIKRLKELHYTIASAESCTGGLFASTIISVPHTSSIINASIVTYANDAKIKYCGVNPDSIAKYGVVSEQVAGEMALGIAKECNANVGVSFSGIAGPTGATLNKPVGMVCFGISINGKLSTYTMYFNGTRTANRRQSVDFMINKLLELLWYISICLVLKQI